MFGQSDDLIFDSDAHEEETWVGTEAANGCEETDL